MDNTWTAWERGKSRMVLRRKPYGYGWEAKPPTAAEINEAVAKENALKDEADARRRFRERPEWALADEIRGAIEAMEPDRHPLDNLTLAQWRAFHAAITNAPSPCTCGQTACPLCVGSVPEGVTIVSMSDTAGVHAAIAEAVGE